MRGKSRELVNISFITRCCKPLIPPYFLLRKSCDRKCCLIKGFLVKLAVMADVLWVNGLQVGVLLPALTTMDVFRDFSSFIGLINGNTHCVALYSEAAELVLTLIKCLSCTINIRHPLG